MGLLEETFKASFRGDSFHPELHKSKNYKHWVSAPDEKRCVPCKEKHGKIWPINEEVEPEPPLHMHCRCIITAMDAITAGTATKQGTDGADWTLTHSGTLPDCYISQSDAISAGWKNGKWLSNFVQSKMLTAGAYKNRNEHLPQGIGRIWYEADINYTSGKRNAQRIIWSNDGLFFVTYDHYETFYEITWEAS